jgi:hypothetical protein
MRTRVLLLAGLLSLGVVALYSARHSFLPPAPDGPPRFDCPAELDLGTREMGELAVAKFTIANGGGAELVIDQVRTSCSCTGVERERDGQYFRVEEIRLGPGERGDFAMRVSVRGVPADSEAVNTVYFRTNDPDQPEGQIRAVIRRVTAGVFASPDTIVTGTVLVGGVVRHAVDIRDDAAQPRRLAKVSTTGSGRVTAKLLDGTGPPTPTDRTARGVLIGRVEILVDTSTPGEIDEPVTVHVQGRELTPDSIRIVGRVAPTIEVTPAVIVLPRRSSSGPVYSARCVCRDNKGRPIEVTVDSSPAGVSVVPLARSSPAVPVEVTISPGRIKATAGGSETVSLRVKSPDSVTTLKLTVIIQPE